MPRIALVVVAAAAVVSLTVAAIAAPPQRRVPTPLTRIYVGSDGTVLYVRQLEGKVYGFGEHPGQKYAYVLTGSVVGDRITGSWWDVPKGARAEQGSLSLRWSQDGARIVRSGGTDLGHDTYTAIAPSAVPWPNRQVAGFQARGSNDLDGVFVGDDASRHYVRETGGNAVWVAERASQPGERPGWVSVFVGKRSAGGTGFSGTYVDVPKGLESESGNFGAGLVGAKRQLFLTQLGVARGKKLSGLPKVSCNGGSPYDCLVKMLKEGRTQSFAKSYNTHAYDLLRWLVPLVENTNGMKAQFEFFDCKNEKGILNQKVSEKFNHYVFDRVLEPVGAKASYYPSGEWSYNYDFANQGRKGEPRQADFFERAGSGKLYISVLDYVRFLGALDRGEIVSASLVETMKGTPGNQLGFDGFYSTTTSAGSYVWKNGRCPDDFGFPNRRCSTAAMIFPGGIHAYVAANSDFSNIQNVLGRAFDRALK